jgi:predicted AlkP superfamily phosphohydrolase/phosphomutase
MNEKETPPLVILGIDAGDPGFIEQWAREGYLPTIASIMERGCWAQTGGPELVSEHGVWVSLFSGISRSQHGYYYFRQLTPGTYDLQTVTGRDVNAPPFWSRLQSRDIKLAVIDVPDSQLFPGMAGVQLANWATHNNWNPATFTPASEPPEVLQEVRQQFGERLAVAENHQSSIEEDQQIYRKLIEHVHTKGALCRQLLGRERFDLSVVVFSQSHAANHQFWKYRPDAHPDPRLAPSGLGHAIRDVYQAIDGEIGLLLAQLPAESNVVVVSSVGMEDDYPTTGLIEAFCRKLGYEVVSAPAGIPLRPIDLARRCVPERWRIALSRHLSRERGERLLAEQFRSGTDWSNTTAFAIPAAYTSFVRVNLRGREPEGIVEPGAEYDALLDRMEVDLEQLVDAETGESAVTRLVRTAQAFGCGPHPTLPDLFVEWRPGRFMRRVIHPRAEIIQEKPVFFRVSDHSSSGFVVAAGPSIPSFGAQGMVGVLDLAPTFLTLLGEPIPDSMTGQVVDAMVSKGARLR